MQKINLTKVYRWMTFVVVLLIQAGAFLEGEYITGVFGLLFCFFLTVPEEKIKTTLKTQYFLLYILFLLVFLIASWSDAT